MISTPFLFSFLALAAPNQTDDVGTAPFLGVKLYEVPESLSAQLGIEGGALVAGVVKDSPAEKAGLRKHDVVTEFDGKTLENARLLQESIRALKPGAEISIVVLRDAKPVTIKAVLGAVANPEPPALPPADDPPGFLGIHVTPVPQSVALHLGLDADAGASVSGVFDDSPARTAGIQVHDVIVKVAGKKLTNPLELVEVLRERKAGQSVDVTWIHRGSEQTKSVTLVERPKRLGRAGAPQSFGPGLPGDLPQHFFKGRLLWTDPEGNEHVFRIPRFSVPDPTMHLEEWKGQLKRQWEDWSTFPDALQGRIEDLMEKYHADLDHSEGPFGAADSRSSRHSITVTNADAEGYEVTVRQVDGRRSVTVKKDGEVIAENLDAEKIDTLPVAVQERVRKVTGGLPSPSPTPLPKASRENEGLRF